MHSDTAGVCSRQLEMQEQVCDPNKRGSHRHPELGWVPAMAQRWFPATNISTPCCPVLFLRVSPCWHLEQSWTTACSCTGFNTVLLQKAVPVHRNTTWTPDEEFDFIRAAQAHLIRTAMSLLPAFLHYFFSWILLLHSTSRRKKKKKDFFPPELIPIHCNETNAMFWTIKAGKGNYFLHHSDGNEA